MSAIPYPFPPLRFLDYEAFEAAGLDMQAFQLATGTNRVVPKQKTSQHLIDKLLELKEKRRTQDHVVSRGRALSPQLIATAAVHMLRSCFSSDEAPPAELVRLFAILHKLEVAGRDQIDEYALRWAATHEALHPDASLREIALIAGVAPNTVKAWKRGQTYQNFRDMVRRAWDEKGFWPIWTDERPPWETDDAEVSPMISPTRSTRRSKRT